MTVLCGHGRLCRPGQGTPHLGFLEEGVLQHPPGLRHPGGHAGSQGMMKTGWCKLWNCTCWEAR